MKRVNNFLVILFLIFVSFCLAEEGHYSVAVVPDVDQKEKEKNQCDSTINACQAPISIPSAPKDQKPTTTTPASTEKIDVFQPTTEWKDILPNQQVPGGLHIRMNLQTGRKQAKLLDPKDRVDKRDKKRVQEELQESADANIKRETTEEDSHSSNTQERGEANEVEKTTNREGEDIGNGKLTTDKVSELNVDNIYETLAQLPAPPTINDLTLRDAAKNLSPQEFRQQVIRLWRERQAELLEASNQVQDSAKYMVKLISKISTGSLEEELIALEEIENEVQDLDKAKDFYTLGGLHAVIHRLNHSNPNIQTLAAWVIGSAVKHYVDAQKWALNEGALLKIMNALDHNLDSFGNAALAKKQQKMMYALSSLVRMNSEAQKIFIEENGLGKVLNLLDKNNHNKVKLKVLAFVHDLLQEVPTDSPDSLLRLQQKLRSDEWCKAVPKMLKEKCTETRHKTLLAMLALRSDICNTIFKSTPVAKTLREIKEEWESSSVDIDPEYLAELKLLVRQILENK